VTFINPTENDMTYPCTECILDELAASGPQELADLRRQCRTQAVPFTPELFDLAIGELIGTKKIVIDPKDGDPFFDLPPSYYNAPIN
jgi:hypothetical protein